MKEATLLFLYRPKEQQILLAMKKRGFGMGKWNGVGGKPSEGESIEEATVREAKEEIDVAIDPTALRRVATMEFEFTDKPEFNQRVHAFFTESWSGEPKETEEMRPQWYALADIPYESMWIDDRHWLPRVLEGQQLKARFVFTETGDEIVDMTINQA